MNVAKRFSAVQAAMSKQGIAKTGKNKQQGYAYRGIDQVMNTLAGILAEHELMIIPNVVAHGMEKGTTRNGGSSFHHTVQVEYFIVGPEGDQLGPYRSHGECIDTSDKGLNKACTAAYKYWVLTALCVPLEGQDDADADTPEHAVNQEDLLTEDQRHEILGLCMQTNTNVDQFVEWLGYGKMLDIPASEFARAKRSLEKKLSEQSKDYAEGEQQSAHQYN